LLKRARKLLDGGEQRIVLHGLGAAIHRCVMLALQLHSGYGNAISVRV
jgi:hypothetical protein